MLLAHWRRSGYTVPNLDVYPFQWLWDSCFHSIVWSELGEPERARSELATALSGQDAEGFVPHLLYLDRSDAHAGFWGRPATSSITQPPIYGHTVAELIRRGVDVDGVVIEQSVEGVRFLLERRRSSRHGLIELVHPWESGCDHSPRWDDLMVPSPEVPGAVPVVDPYDEAVWFERKGTLLDTVHRSSTGSPRSATPRTRTSSGVPPATATSTPRCAAPGCCTASSTPATGTCSSPTPTT